MNKKIVFSFFIVTLMILFIAITYFDISSYGFYGISTILTLLGFYLYPVNKKLKEMSDFLMMPLFIVILSFNFFNVFFIKNFSESISLINIALGMFGFAQYFFKRIRKKPYIIIYKRNTDTAAK